MKKYECTCVVLFLLVCQLEIFSQNLPPEIIVFGEQIYCSELPVPIVSSANISDPNPEDTTLPEVFIQIAEGYEIGQDVLTLGGVNPNISSSWNPSEGLLTLTGPATFTEFENAIENIFFQTTQTSFTQDRQFSVNLSDANYLPTTGHYYIYVSDTGITWTQARDNAAAQTYFGLQGYLATITTAEESQLAGEQSPGTGWIGGSDQQNEGTWIWETGPEAGQVFWQGVSNGSAPNGMYAFWNNNEPNNFNEEDYAHITDPSIGVLGAWNDLGNAGDPGVTNPYHPQGYIVEFGGMPGDSEINLSASSTMIMPRIFIDNITICGSDTVTLSVEASTNNVLWFETPTSTIPIHSGLNYETVIDTTITFWLAPSVAGCTDTTNRFPLTVTTNPTPSLVNLTIIQCEDNVMDGISTFNLNDYIDSIMPNDSSNINIQFFENMDLSSSINAENYTNQFNNQIIYVVATNSTTNCSARSEVVLSVNSNASNTANLIVCDNFEETGLANFDLTLASNQILNGEASDVIILGYFETFSNALIQENQLTLNFTNTEPYNQTIYARLEQNGSCYSIAEVNLEVQNIPNLRKYEEVYYCLNSFPETITLEGGVTESVPNNYYYNWSTGETTINIEVNDIGTYEVLVTKPLGCTNQRTIVVLASSTAIIETIEITDLSENNTISILVSGDGDYVYALDDENGMYQESNNFENVPAGIHSVYIKDIKADCGIVSGDVSVLGFPKFFTPNGDTVNDTWQIKGFSSEFEITARIEIFNRFGKLITVLNSNNLEWNGTFNGELLPADDYWFVAKLQYGRTYNGHFTLKR